MKLDYRQPINFPARAIQVARFSCAGHQRGLGGQRKRDSCRLFGHTRWDVARGVGHKIEPLSLVKVYGIVAKAGSKGELPRIDAAFIRDWHWGTFTFLAAAGDQHGSEGWRKLNEVDLDDIYDPYPDDQYYEQRLGKRPQSIWLQSCTASRQM